MPSSRQARMTRTAISPRLATSTRRKRGRSEGDVPMLLRRVALALVLQHLERPDEARPRVLGLDDLVDVAELGGLEGIREGVAIVGHEALALLLGPWSGLLDLVAEDDVDRAVGPHD